MRSRRWGRAGVGGGEESVGRGEALAAEVVEELAVQLDELLVVELAAISKVHRFKPLGWEAGSDRQG